MTRRATGITLLVVAAVAAALLVPVASGSSSAKYSVRAVDFKFVGMPKTVSAGAQTFTLVNRGQASHDLKIGGKKTKLLSPGQKAVVSVVLKKGKYTFLCTVPGHAALGMKGTLIVR